jgi:hypothetical protein
MNESGTGLASMGGEEIVTTMQSPNRRQRTETRPVFPAAPDLTPHEQQTVLRLLAALMWADFRPDLRLLTEAHRALGGAPCPNLAKVLARPPRPEQVDPQRCTRAALRTALHYGRALARVRPSMALHERLELLHEFVEHRPWPHEQRACVAA